jgi:hypothetical protein
LRKYSLQFVNLLPVEFAINYEIHLSGGIVVTPQENWPRKLVINSVNTLVAWIG